MLKIKDDEFHLLATYIEEHSGIHLKKEKKTLLVGRLSNMLTDMGIDDFTTYYHYLQNDSEGKELSRLIDKITTNHTYFMREAEHFNYFVQTVLPYLKETIKSRDLRVWCAASSSGEEPYTLAILMEEFFKNDFITWDKKLLATDLSLSVLEQAKKGCYSSDKVQALPKAWVLNYFDRMQNGDYQVKDKLKEQVVYRRFNLLEQTYPFKKKFHVIFCRNVMIYFDAPVKEAILRKLYHSLEPGGYLFIGHSESINRETSPFRYIRPAVYRKND